MRYYPGLLLTSRKMAAAIRKAMTAVPKVRRYSPSSVSRIGFRTVEVQMDRMAGSVAWDIEMRKGHDLSHASRRIAQHRAYSCP
jgi:hypothetical protein